MKEAFKKKDHPTFFTGDLDKMIVELKQNLNENKFENPQDIEFFKKISTLEETKTKFIMTNPWKKTVFLKKSPSINSDLSKEPFRNLEIAKRIDDLDKEFSEEKNSISHDDKKNIGSVALLRFKKDSEALKKRVSEVKLPSKKSFDKEVGRTRIQLYPKANKEVEIERLSPEKAENTFKKIFQKNLFDKLGLKGKFERPVVVRDRVAKSTPKVENKSQNYIVDKISKAKNMIYFMKSIVDFSYAKITIDKFTTAREIVEKMKIDKKVRDNITKKTDEFFPENFYVTADYKSLKRYKSVNNINKSLGKAEAMQLNDENARFLKNSMSNLNLKMNINS